MSHILYVDGESKLSYNNQIKKSKSSKGIKASLSQIFKKNRKLQVADSESQPDYNSSMHRYKEGCWCNRTGVQKINSENS